MYDVLFIDDKFEEVQETFLTLKESHIRCFYTDADPEKDGIFPLERDKLLFKNVKYICLDLFLANRGIDESHLNKNAVSTLANVVKKFTINKDYKIIIASAHIEDFKKYEDDFKEYIGDVEVITEEKDADASGKRFSILHKNEPIFKEILQNSIQNNLRNLIIKEAIEIENSIWEKINNEDCQLKGLLEYLPTRSNPNFGTKIELFNFYFVKDNKNITIENLHTFRNLRNDAAHKDDSGKLIKDVKKFVKLFDEKCIVENEKIIAATLHSIEKLKGNIKNV